MKYIIKTRKALSVLKKKHNGGTNSFGLVFAKRDTVYHMGQVCYAALNYKAPDQAPGQGPVAFISLVGCSPCGHDRDVAILFLDWTFRESPFKDAFYTKSGRKGLDKGIICHTDKVAPFVIAALGLPREIKECPQKVKVWGELVDMGMDPLYAYVATYIVQKLSTGFQIKRPPYNSNHLSLGYPLTKRYIKNFCNGHMVPNTELKLFKDRTLFSGVFNLWDTDKHGDGYRWEFTKKETDTEEAGWGRDKYINHIIVYKTKKEQQEFVREFTAQIEEIRYG